MTIHSDDICDYFHFNFNLPTPPHPNNAKWFVNVYTPDGKTSCFCGKEQHYHKSEPWSFEVELPRKVFLPNVDDTKNLFNPFLRSLQT